MMTPFVNECNQYTFGGILADFYDLVKGAEKWLEDVPAIIINPTEVELYKYVYNGILNVVKSNNCIHIPVYTAEKCILMYNQRMMKLEFLWNALRRNLFFEYYIKFRM